MYESFDRVWTSWTNSNTFRRLTKHGIGAVVFRSNAYRKLNLTRRYITSYYKSRKDPTFFKDLETFCIFIGNNKSGSSMIGSLLDAHPNVIFSDEEDALQYIGAGFSQDQIFHILLRGSRREAMKGRVTARRLMPYSFQVPGQWQGHYNRLRVIGDTTTGTTTQRFARDPGLLQRLQSVMIGVDVKFIQVIRNPYDTISYLMVRGKRTYANAIKHYFTNCETLVELSKRLDGSNFLPVKYEDFIYRAEDHLAKICHFLGIEPADDYLKACMGILHKSPDQNRHMVEWDARWIGVVKSKIDQFDFLEGYSFENQEKYSSVKIEPSISVRKS